MHNTLYAGLYTTIELPKGSFAWIGDEVPEHPKAKVFDPLKHTLNLFEHPLNLLEPADYRKACDMVSTLMALFPGGENTLTKEGVPLVLLDALDGATRFDRLFQGESKDPSYISAQRMVRRILKSPVLRRVLCSERKSFSFEGANRKVFVRLNRAELGEFDALALGLLVMAHYKGQLVVEDLGFYGRDLHVGLVEQERLIAGVNFLDELPDKLRQRCLLIEDKVLSGASLEDAEKVAKYEGYAKGTTGFHDFVKGAIE